MLLTFTDIPCFISLDDQLHKANRNPELPAAPDCFAMLVSREPASWVRTAEAASVYVFFCARKLSVPSTLLSVTRIDHVPATPAEVTNVPPSARVWSYTSVP